MMVDDNWVQEFHTQGLLLLDKIPEILPEDGMQTMPYKTMTDIPDEMKTCLQLLYKIFYCAVFALTRNKYQVQTVLLKRAADTETSNASITLDSLILSADGKKCWPTFHNTVQLTKQGDNADENSVVSDACVPSKLIPGHAAEDRVLPTNVPLKQKPSPTKESHVANLEKFSDSEKNDSYWNEQTYSQFNSVSSPSSKGFLPLADKHTINDKTHVSNEQPQHEVIKYQLRKRKPCCAENMNSVWQTEVSQSIREEKSVDTVDMGDGSIDDGNWSAYVKPKRISTLTPAHCLVLKQPICCICSLSFSSHADCVMHWRQDHIVTDPSRNTKPYLPCQQCPVRFAVPPSRINSDLHVGVRVARWLNHAIRMHNSAIPSDVERFTCTKPGCGFIALTPASYQIHRQKNRHDDVIGRGMYALIYLELRCFLCTSDEGCGETFMSKPALRDHIVKKHVQRDQVRQFLICPVCNAERPLNQPRLDGGDRSKATPCRRFFYVAYRLLHHLVSKHGWSVPEYIQSYPCKFPDCRYIAVAQSDLDSHSISHDRTDGSGGGRNPSLPCEKCGKLVKFRAMQSHSRLCQVSLEDRQTLKCPYCNSRLSSRYNLRYHINAVHSGTGIVKEFLCSYCTYSCHHKSTLEEHIFHRHGSNISRRSVVSCSLCSFKTIKPGALRRHISIVHSDAKTFRCPVCDKMFKCQLHLKNHMVAHEERRFMCPSCNYRAARKANLAAHVLAQHGSNRKLYRCIEPCQYATGYASNLTKHQRLFCKYRQRNSSCTTSVNASGTVTDIELENETATIRNTIVTGISKASWHVWSGSALNSFGVSADSQTIQDVFEQCGTK